MLDVSINPARLRTIAAPDTMAPMLPNTPDGMSAGRDRLPAITPQARAVEILGRRPPMPPPVQESSWTWTPEKLKAVYLDAYTELSKSEIAEIVSVDPKTFYKWRNQVDYKTYLAALVYTDGLGDRVERVKKRRALADKMVSGIMRKLEADDWADREKLPALIKALETLLTAIGDDVNKWEDASALAAAGRAAPRGALDMAARLAEVEDPKERETIKRYLLSTFKGYIDGAASRAPIPGEVEKPPRAEGESAHSLDGFDAEDTEKPEGLSTTPSGSVIEASAESAQDSRTESSRASSEDSAADAQECDF